MRGITCSVLICVLLSLTSVSLGAADVAELRRKCEAGKRKDCEKLAAFHQKTCSAANIEACEEYLSVARRAGLMWNAPSISPDQLFDAAKAGDVMAVVSALSAGASVGSLTPTRQAIWALGKPDYSPTGSSGLQGEGWSALTFAAENGHLSVARCLVAAGVDVNVADASGATPIMHAIWAHHPEVVGYLADHGASTKEKKFGMTMIMLAAASSCPACIDELVAHGHKADERTSDGRTPLFFVGEGGNDDAIAGTIASLRKAGVDARATDASGATALVAMLRNPPSAFRREQIARIAPMLVDAGTDVWLRDSAGRNVLGYAVERCDSPLIRALSRHLAGSAIAAQDLASGIDALETRIKDESGKERTARVAMPDGSTLIVDAFSYGKNVRASSPPALRIVKESDGILIAQGLGAISTGGSAMLAVEGEQLLVPDRCDLSCSIGAKWVFAKAGMSFRNGSWMLTTKEDNATIEFREDGVLLRGFDCRNIELRECQEMLPLLKGLRDPKTE